MINIYLFGFLGANMKKITDRFLLGTIAGLVGNIAKVAVEKIATNTIGFEESGAKKAAGIFLEKRDVSTIQGKIIGNIADNMIATGLGVICVYWLTLMGKDYYLLKGAALGSAEWATLYGALSNMGATNIYPTKPKDGLVQWFSHVTFGIVKICIVARLGDERLFKPNNLTLEIDNSTKAKFDNK